MKKHTHLLDLKTKLVLGGIFLLAAFFRFYNLNWDQGLLFHPDERNIANAVSNLTLFSQMDPKFYAYGGFLIYLYKCSADAVGTLLHNPSLAHDWAWINLIGRSYSAFFSVMTIFPLFFLAKKLFSKNVAFLSCLFYALCVSSIQTAHYSTTENLLTFLIVLISFLSLIFYEKHSFKLSFILGLAIGIAVATKTTGIAFFVVPGIALVSIFFKQHLRFSRLILLALIMGATAFVVFTICSPYTFLNWDNFIESMNYENSVVLGTNRVVYTLQFSHTTKYLFQLKNLFWQLGLFAALSLLGVLVTIKQELTKKRVTFVIFIFFPLLYFAYVGSWYTKFNRYMVPLLPFFIIFGSNLLGIIMTKTRRGGIVLSTLAVVVTLLYALAFFSIYTSPQTRIKASQWIYQHVPPGNFILSEHWDEGLPIPLPGYDPSQYQLLPLTIYEPDNAAKIDYYANYLSQANYLTINSRRLYGTLLHLPEKYPLTQKYYQLLFAGKLGYQKVAEFSSYPRLLGFTLNDDSSEETFQVYDHPKAMIFENVKHYSFTQLHQILSQQ
ncbi:MAG TPA: glycosyltransferase family 39 protein [Patescibacteria group bacterium]|nr:glycosyltransferase family 39 protein [Patescibacteria group bacterium]